MYERSRSIRYMGVMSFMHLYVSSKICWLVLSFVICLIFCIIVRFPVQLNWKKHERVRFSNTSKIARVRWTNWNSEPSHTLAWRAKLFIHSILNILTRKKTFVRTTEVKQCLQKFRWNYKNCTACISICFAPCFLKTALLSENRNSSSF